MLECLSSDFKKVYIYNMIFTFAMIMLKVTRNYVANDIKTIVEILKVKYWGGVNVKLEFYEK